ncbi:MAG: CGNR zinc finger domain-containing protein [Desulfobacterales bacterium]|nr:CGNR zinc finger domain-containing protein [Desulfobacterales bacterium]
MKNGKKHAGNLSLLGGCPCLDFVNTLDWRGTDHPLEFLHTYQDLVAWSRHAGTISTQEAGIISQRSKNRPSKQTKVLGKAIKLRETIYRVFSSLSEGRPAATEDLAAFNKFLSRTVKNSQIVRAKDGYNLDSRGEMAKLDWILNPLIRSAADLLISDERKSVKKCGDPACGWLFLDTSRNKSRRWCDMSDCGNRAKASRFYKKKAAKLK